MQMMMATLLGAVAGYVASIYTWPALRRGLVGIEKEIDELRAKARALERRLRG